MTAEPWLHSTTCALCGPRAPAVEVYPPRLGVAAFSGATFSARRPPDRMHYRIVRCATCGLVRSDPVMDGALLGRLYAESAFTYADEVDPLRRTYAGYLRRLERYGARKESLLEIGCGNGFFLEAALDQGYVDVRGVEPSRVSIDHASPRVKPFLVCDVLRPGLFDAASFDVVCLFQVLDHVPEPRAFLDECWRVLRPGGLLLAINHNVRSLSAGVLGERSPIFDIEHTYLYAPSTMAAIARLSGFELLAVTPAVNTCSVGYLLQLLPVPQCLKHLLRTVAERLHVSRATLTLPLGNLLLVGRKPARELGSVHAPAPAGIRSAP